MAAGYDRIAAFLASDPPSMFFRRFARLNAKNILYYQAELGDLAADLEEIISLDRDSASRDGGNEKHYPFSIGHLKGSLGNSENASMQWEKFLEIRKLLKEYNEALIQQSQLMRLRSPDEAELAGFREWLRCLEGGPSTRHQWDDQDDLVAILARQDGTDHFTRWIYRKALPWFHERWGYRFKKTPDPEIGAYLYRDESIKSFTNALSIFISGLLPASSIIVLFFVKSVPLRLAIIFIYNITFAMVLGFMVKARRSEMFAASTAFAAVQVALITSSDGKSC
ncbi:uncharacterized protein BDW47DRAFT_111024 [Aspergillus candidus]|uniref:DUF6594 domain-containing protein n=1 Tax=Aspergillus candidus TaxID=41067 RepID=A0A2I2F3F0_ASPCN|nr:hypothetical protein BDW47DRAFT_111024 [Aspergillus candidus]PLB35139.1 hypothetical protein BDW47DRAFT_111024 [Aspergillus candidus]